MKKTLLLLTIFASVTFLQAQSSFQKAISIPFMSNPTPRSIVQCADGGYLIGTSSGYYLGSGACLIKTDATGQVTWTKSLASPSGNLNLIQAGECVGGGYYVFGDNSDSSWMASGFTLTKLDAAGNILWGKTYPNAVPGYGSSKIRPTSDGGFIISESLYSKMGAVKLDGNGNVVWSTAFSDDPNDQSPKCPSFDCFISGDGSMVFTGKRNNDILLIKTDPTGQMQWSSTLGNGMSYYHANGISNTSDGGYIVCGYDDYYPFSMKVSATGSITWYHAYTSSAWGGEFSQIKELANGNFIALGTDYYSNSFIVILDANGSILSSSAFGNSSGGVLNYPTMCATADGGYIIAGAFYDPGNGLTAVSIMKTDANGNFNCNFNYFPMSFNTTQVSPYTLNVPIYSFTQGTVSTPLTANATSLNSTEMDFCLLFSTDDLESSTSISAFPNPIAAGENLRLNVSGVDETATISIYDANGRIVKTMNQNLSMSTNSIEISTLDFTSGIYLVRMTGEKENVLGTTRFIVR